MTDWREKCIQRWSRAMACSSASVRAAREVGSVEIDIARAFLPLTPTLLGSPQRGMPRGAAQSVCECRLARTDQPAGTTAPTLVPVTRRTAAVTT